MTISDLFDRTLDQTVRIVSGVQPGQLTEETPCDRWDVRTVIGHLVRGNQNLVAGIEGRPRNPEPVADVGANPIEAYRESAEAAREAWRSHGDPDLQFQTPLGPMSGRDILTLRIADAVTHGWDIAAATGQLPVYDPDIVQAALDFAHARLPATRPEILFAAPVDVPDDLPAIDRLAAFLGRHPR